MVRRSVRWIIGADAIHHLFLGKLYNFGWVRACPCALGSLGDYKKQYPDAKLIAVDEAAKKKEKEGLKFDGRTCLSCALGGPTSLFCAVWGADPPNSKYGFEDDVSACAAYSGGTHLTTMCADQTLDHSQCALT